MIRYLKQKAAQRELARIVAANCKSYELRRYRERRAAALKGKRVTA
jgi:hypothetical protein